jgi:hypothetical protein
MDGAHRLTFGGRRIRGLIGLVLCGVAVSVALAVALPAQAATRFSDNFEDGNANGWTFTGGSWAVMSEDGSFVLRQQASLAGVAAAVANVTGPGSGFPTFVAASAKPRTALGGTGSVAVLFNAADANNYFYAALRATVLEIGMRQNGTPRVLATTPYAATVGTWQRLTIDLNLPGRIGVIAAGTGPGAQVAVTGLGAATFGNRVGFAATDASASFDNISIVDDVAPDTIPPTTPGTPVASNPTPSGFTLRWAASTDNVGVTGYEVQTVVPPGSTVPIRVWRTPTNSITITDLPARSTWTLHVRAFDAANNFSPFSGNVTASTLPPADQVPPTAPGKPVASNITPTGLTLSWTPSTDNVGVTRYAVSESGAGRYVYLRGGRLRRGQQPVAVLRTDDRHVAAVGWLCGCLPDREPVVGWLPGRRNRPKRRSSGGQRVAPTVDFPQWTDGRSGVERGVDRWLRAERDRRRRRLERHHPGGRLGRVRSHRHRHGDHSRGVYPQQWWLRTRLTWLLTSPARAA